MTWGADDYENEPRRRRGDDLTVNEYRLLAAESRLDKLEVRLGDMTHSIEELNAAMASIPGLIGQKIAESATTTIKWVVGTGLTVAVLVVMVVEGARAIH